MVDVKFGETVIFGAMGRNGLAHMAGLTVQEFDKKVRIAPLRVDGGVMNASMMLMASDCGRIVRAIAETAVAASPADKEEIAAQLRAALVTIESGAHEALDDTVSSFEGFRR